VRVTAARVGDPSPLQAIDDELREDPAYDGLIISTLPAGMSRWLRMDVCKEAERRFGKRVIAVTAEPTPLSHKGRREAPQRTTHRARRGHGVCSAGGHGHR
jgi:hypothetical protein